ncbi:MAG: DUF3822 family protein [Marinirhabdus sp.]
MTPQKTNNTVTTTHKSLSVQVSLFGHSFLASNPNTKKVSFFSEKKYGYTATPEDILTEIKNDLTSQKELKQTFSNVTVCFQSPIYTPVPLSLYDPTKASEYLKFNTKILANDHIATDTLKNEKIAVVYVPYVNVNNHFFETFGSFAYYHASTLLLKHFLPKYRTAPGPKLVLHLTEGFLDCIVIEKGKLMLCNTYPFRTAEDFMYYVLFCLEQLQLTPETIETVALGTIDESDENFEILYKYIRNVSIYAPESGVFIENQPRHKNVVLQTLAACG